MKLFALITAGGEGRRMGSGVPKQFLELDGRPILMHSIQAFLNYAPDMELVVVLPEDWFGPWKALCQTHRFMARHRLAISGPTRFHSVKNGLRQVPGEALVAIHDGARPLLPLSVISRVFENARKFGNAIPVTEPGDSLRTVEGAMSAPLDRMKVRLVQTPQCFHAGEIKKAYERNFHESFTDDATVLEAAGGRLFLVDGSRENIKITTPTDIILARGILSERAS
jgi:2-C-methyl-D-erythritol 4-phosphate cytidylyltransferase